MLDLKKTCIRELQMFTVVLVSVSFQEGKNQRDIKLAIKQERYRVFADFHGDGVKRGLLFLAALELLKDTGLFN